MTRPPINRIRALTAEEQRILGPGGRLPGLHRIAAAADAIVDSGIELPADPKARAALIDRIARRQIPKKGTR